MPTKMPMRRRCMVLVSVLNSHPSALPAMAMMMPMPMPMLMVLMVLMVLMLLILLMLMMMMLVLIMLMLMLLMTLTLMLMLMMLTPMRMLTSHVSVTMSRDDHHVLQQLSMSPLVYSWMPILMPMPMPMSMPMSMPMTMRRHDDNTDIHLSCHQSATSPPPEHAYFS